MKHLTLLFAVIACFCNSSHAQTILFRDQTLQPKSNIEEVRFNDLPASEVFAGRFYRLVQFDHIPNADERSLLEAKGINLIEYVPHQAYIASLADGMDPAVLKAHGVKWVGELTSEHKAHRWLSQQPYPDYVQTGNGIKVMLRFHRDVSYQRAKQFLLVAGVEPTVEFPHADLMEAVVSEELIFDIAALPFVAFVDMASEPGEPESLEGQIQHRSNGINTATYGGLKYDGTGVSLVINDDGFVGPHIDYKGRTDQSDVLGDNTGTHGDMTAGIAGGAGNIDPSIQGMAPGSFVWVRQYVSSLPNTVSLHTDEGVMAFSSSYSNGCNAGYTSITQLVDQETKDHPTLIQSFSAGNSNNNDCGYGAGNQWGNVTGGHKIAKNAIAAANLLQNEVLVGSSSRGPASDGRIKPDIASHGNSQLSLSPNNAYSPGGGTSAACPGITGIFAQLVQAHRDINGTDAESGLLKACMLNSAHDLGNVGPDFKFGWGRVNAWRAYEIIADNRYFDATVDQGGSNTHTINIPAGVDEARIMVYWMDPAASTSAAKALVNDLDMSMSNGGTTYLPWVLDPTPDPALLDLPATNGVDTLNNMEQVAIVNPAGGSYTLTVNGTEVPMGPQKYYVVYEFFQGVRLTYPIGGEGLEPGTTELLAWDAVGTAGTFDLDYSTDGGASWNVITTGVAGNLRQFNWNVPNTPSGDVLVRVVRGADSDASDEELSIMDVPTNLAITTVCPSYMRVTWDPVPNATDYAVHLLGAMYMDSVDHTAATTFDIPIINPNDEQWFAVTAYGADGMRSRRAIAVQFAGGGPLNCPVDHDASIASIIRPSSTFISCDGSLTSDVVVDLANPGLNDESNIGVNYRFNGGAIVSEVYTPTLPANSSVIYTFATGVTLSGSTDVLEVWTSLASDLATYNDSMTVNVNVLGGAGTSIPFNENFESEALCGTSSDCGGTTCPLAGGWVNLINGVDDDVDWRVHEGPTGSAGTGPSVDATTGSATGNYVYLETSGTCNGEEAQLLSPCIDLSAAIVPELTYSYHLFGDDMGELHVDLFDGATWVNDITPVVQGNQGNQWVLVAVDLSAYVGSTVVIRFRGITGSSFESDMALDDILVSEQPACAFPNGLTVNGAGVGAFDASWTCVGCTGTFYLEYGPVGFTPGAGVTAGGGTVFSNVSSPVNVSGLTGCISYDVYVRQDCGVDGFSFNSSVQTVSVTGSVVAPYTQDFDALTPENGGVGCGGVDNVGLCWSNDLDDANDWTARSVATGSSNTGPTADNTGGGNYLFIETSSPCFPSVSGALFSPTVDVSSLVVPELRFWYHMWGVDMGTLEVHASEDGGMTFGTTALWSLSGDQGNGWLEGVVSLAAFAGETDLMIRFTGTSGSGFTSDIALDDIDIDETPACPRPSLVSVNNVTSDNAEVTWSCALCTGTINLEFGAAGFTPGGGTVVNGISSPYMLSGLNSGTAYDVYIWQDCGGGDVSQLSLNTPFVTLPSCGDQFYDNGGAASTYLANSNELLTLCPSVVGERMRVTFTSFEVETNWDALYVFDGPDTSYPLIASANPAPNGGNVYGAGGYWGTTAPGPFVSSDPSGCLTIAFTSDGSVQQAGWDASITCEPQPAQLQVKVMLEGPYNQGSLLLNDGLRVNNLIPDVEPYTGLGFANVHNCACPPLDPALLAVTGDDAIVDWVLVEVRDVNDPTIIITAVPALLQRDGDVVDRDGNATLQLEVAYGDHYVAVRHRNHLGAMGAAALTLNLTPSTIDFTDPLTNTWGTGAQMTVNGVNMLRMGNVFGDGLLKYTGNDNDRDPILVMIGGSVPTNTVIAYETTDTNMDGTTKYVGADNDRDPILVNVGGSVPTATRAEQLP